MRARWPQRTLLILLASLSVLLSAELLFLNAVFLPAMQGILTAAYRGASHPLIDLAFQRIATDAYKIPLWMYQDKLAYAYEAMKIPALVLVVGATLFVWLSTRPPKARLAIRNWPQRFAYLVFCCLSLALLVHARLGTYSRFMADDFCSAADVREMGFVGANIHSYLTFSDRYSATFLDALASVLGPYLASFSTAVVLSSWFAATTFALFQFPLAERKLTRLCLAALLSAAVVFSTLRLSFHLPQSLYWGQGMHSVVPPLVLSAVCVGILQYRLARPQPSSYGWLWGLSGGGVAFVAAGFSETYSALQVTAWTLLAVAAVASDASRFRSKLLRQAAPFLLGSFAGLAFMAGAPGNDVRLGGTDFQAPSPIAVLGIAWSSTFEWLNWAVFSWDRILILVSLLLLCALVSGGFFGGSARFMETAQIKRRALVLLPGATLVLLVSCFSPAAYALSGPPPGRTQIIPGYVLVCAVAFCGAIIGQLAGPAMRRAKEPAPRSCFRPIAVSVLILFLLTTTQATYTQLRQLPAFAQYASRWDANDLLIRSAQAEGADHVVVTRIPENWADMLDREIGDEPTSPINVCASQYYGIEVTAE